MGKDAHSPPVMLELLAAMTPKEAALLIFSKLWFVPLIPATGWVLLKVARAYGKARNSL